MEGPGYRIDAADGVAAMAAIADECLARGARVMRFDQLDAENEYDAKVACASRLHVPTSALSSVVLRIWNALKPEGWHFASFETAASHDGISTGVTTTIWIRGQPTSCTD